MFAQIDPLKILQRPDEIFNPIDFGLKYDQQFIQEIDKDSSYIHQISDNSQTIVQLEEHLKKIYKNTVGVEFEHIQCSSEKSWLYYTFEKYQITPLTTLEKVNIHQLLTQTESLDHFLSKKFQTFKRYAGEGAESAIIGLKAIFAKSSEQDIEDIVLGMPHRGRLNVLCNLLDYPVADLFRKITGQADLPSELYNYVDDVVSHIATSRHQKTFSGTGCKEKPINISMLHNPSHLEAINPVSMGKTKAKQDFGNSTLNIQMHGDAAFSAQGVVYEAFSLSKVPKFTVQGTIHIIVNNQIGFTTSPIDGRSSFHCSEIAKSFDAPILHINADDPESVHKMCKLAVEYRQKFKKDILLDIVSYRRYGHNEVDEPEFTQPVMYKQIKGKQMTCPQIYNKLLIEQGVLKDDVYEKIRQKTFSYLEQEFEKISENQKTISIYKSNDNNSSSAFKFKWQNMDFSIFGKEPSETGFPSSKLRQLAVQSVTIPPDFKVHPRLQKFFIESRLKAIQQNQLDWATCEALAAQSLLDEGFMIRLTGQDVERGTFSQRHWVLTDQNTHQTFNPIKNYAETQNKGKLYVYNSPLSEIGVLSYEYGYSLESPQILSLWEAQFGDFNNSAQVAIDTFLTCSEHKWARQSSLTIILPHGMDGAGPEHSSCRMERFLQMINSDGSNRNFKLKKHDNGRKELKVYDQVFYENYQDINFQVINPTTPANYFHALRRQMKRNYRKPLVIVGPKILLRHNNAKSTFEDLDVNTCFQSILVRLPVNQQTKHILITSGKFSYDILNLINQAKQSATTALIVIEELAPFPEEQLKNIISQANGQNTNVYWVQDEQLNSGAYLYSEPRISRIINELNFKNQNIQYVGRKSSAVTATGKSKGHQQETQELLDLIKSLIII
ncbi:oxoglutarate dehydrogenase, putative [Ichthyophthirius multifiliis]|uniref:Oxoglutarate dehydrogenase, putative n=1 Tax=Ichthyophthirius multifiliis TaxID=5932 RepID=G0QT51_ICHMU|nr:oxoglutarate dehydrogenase, putative [Ichthyophthirius multifiliis]EGR31606.1 oxoglutarate dehydrogenase, putative [Ichthyophthirius multifiliis]|eukprot:XP_004035092.1 oxoglutarate dehydrogenase, putative [Ichthyophthirius multifiliis]